MKNKKVTRALTLGIKNKKAQEEMVGFVIIIILVAVILLVFLGFSLRHSQKDNVEDYEVESFIQAFLQYTTNCSDYNGYLSVRDLIFKCEKSPNEKCFNSEDKYCYRLNKTLSELLDESWKVGEEYPNKGYGLMINSDDGSAVEEVIPEIKKGNVTKNFKSGVQEFSKRGKKFEIMFTAYY